MKFVVRGASVECLAKGNEKDICSELYREVKGVSPPKVSEFQLKIEQPQPQGLAPEGSNLLHVMGRVEEGPVGQLQVRFDREK